MKSETKHSQETGAAKLAERVQVAKYDHDAELEGPEHYPFCVPVETVSVTLLDGEPVTDPELLDRIHRQMEGRDGDR